MGSCASLTARQPWRVPGQASPLYWACRNGDTTTVKKMLPSLTYEQVNQMEQNGSTALHAASFYNQPEIVKLLLENGCSRTTLNFNGVTAYQEAANDEIRVLFNRPTSDRFRDENLTSSFNLRTSNGDYVEMELGIPDDWFRGHRSAAEAEDAKFMLSMTNTANPFKQRVKKKTEETCTNNVNDLIARAVPTKHFQYDMLSDLQKKYAHKMGIGNLLTIYTLDTPLYTVLQNEADSFTALIYFHLQELEDRAYKGRTYRGGTMTDQDINAYRWAREKEGYVLETRTLQSTSLSESTAQGFAKVKEIDDCVSRHSVLLTLDFPEKCPTAINLNKISEKLPTLSAYEHEEEILVLPFTLFAVKEIKIESQSRQYRITLRNVPTPK